jgi:hypothetical protein
MSPKNQGIENTENSSELIEAIKEESDEVRED